MYDINKRIECRNLTVDELIKKLKTLNKDARVLFNGDQYGYLHIEYDNSIISFDDSSLDDLYEHNERIIDKLCEIGYVNVISPEELRKAIIKADPDDEEDQAAIIQAGILLNKYKEG